MHCRLRLLSFGWSPQFIYRHVVEIPLNLNEVEEIIALVVPKSMEQHLENKFRDAFEAVKKFLRSIGCAKEPELIVVDFKEEPLNIFEKLVSYVAGKSCRELIIDVSGGLRLHNVILTLLAFYMSDIIRVRLFVGLETSPKLYEVPLGLIKVLSKINPLHRRVLELIFEHEMSAQELARAVERDVSYVRRILKLLNKYGLVTKVPRGRLYTFKITELGRTTLNLLKLKSLEP